MHTLRYIMGDSVFFPTLKAFATNPLYTYDHFVTTENVLLHFNSAARRNLKPLFELFLYTTDKLQVSIKQTGLQKYEIKLLNLDMDLPVEVVTSKGLEKVIVGKKPVTVISDILPTVDPDSYYLKKIVIE